MIALILAISLIGGIALLAWIAMTQVKRGEGMAFHDEHGPAVVVLDGPTVEAHRRAGR